MLPVASVWMPFGRGAAVPGSALQFPLGEQRKCRVRAGETTLEILERLNLHHQRLPLILQRLSQCGGNWHEIKLDLNAASMEEYQQLAEELARQIGV